MSAEESNNMSALEENISKKGNNAYYYAHGKKIDGPAWDGKEEPRFLGTATVTTATKEFVNTLDTFSWLDDDKYVKIYVEYEGAGNVADEDIVLNENDEKDAVNFRFVKDGKKYALSIAPLNNTVESVSFKKKTDKFIINLKKQSESQSWYQLKKTS